ncbi:hypothetical protein F5Y04DRAFT_283796 [Hypomontagnella monticulosa]|nr:hypothetical protein F5Y04DRAFT_283796 [Hypomontagnella monticulosa]
MRLSAFLCAAALLATSHAKCFTVDDPQAQLWGDTDAVLSGVEFVCKHELTKTYQGHEEAVSHIEIHKDQIFSFKIRRVKGERRSLGFNECVNGMSKEVKGCPHGGQSKYGNWEYTAKPAKTID